MIAIYLDGKQLDTAQDTSIGLTVSLTNVTDVGSTKGSYTKSIKIPATPDNRRAFGFADEILSADYFNNAEHTARIEQDGIELVAGKAYLDNVEQSLTSGYFNMQIVGNDFGWAINIRNKKLNELSADKNFSQFARYALQTDAQRANAFFALIDHGCWWQEEDSDTRTDGATKIRRGWAVQADLVPFVNIAGVLRIIFGGYSIKSPERLMTNFFATLYMTGAYANQDKAGVLSDDNDFEVTGENLDNGDKDGVVSITIEQWSTPSEPIDIPVLTHIEEDKQHRITLTGSKEARDLQAWFTPSQECNVQFRVKGKYETTLGWGLDWYIFDKANKILTARATLSTPIFADTLYSNGEMLTQFRITDSDEWAARYRLNGHEAGKAEFLRDGANLKSDGYLSNWREKCPPEQMCLLYAELSNPELFEEAGYLIVYLGYDEFGVRAIPTTKAIADKMFFVGAQQIRYVITSNRALTIIPYFKGKDGNIYVQWYFTNYESKNSSGNGYQTIANESIEGFYKYDPSIYGAHIKAANMGTAKVWGISQNQRLTFASDKIPTTTFTVPTTDPTALTIGVSSTQCGDLSTNCPHFILTNVEYDKNNDAWSWDYGAETLTVYGSEECSVVPKFGTIPPKFGTNLSLNDVAGDTDVATFLKAVFQLANIRILTNPDTKTVTLITGKAFYTDDEVDWSDRVDLSKSITIKTLCEDIGTKYTLGYQSNSPAIEEYNDRHDEPYAEYSYDLPTKADDNTTDNDNPVFNPAMFTEAKEIFDAQTNDAPLLNLHARDTEQTIEDVDYDWARTIVKENNTGGKIETVTINTRGVIADYEQPSLSFGAIGEGRSLFFGDTMDGIEPVEGLHQYYDTYARMYRTGKRITCYCRIEPQELEAIRKYGTHPTLNFRSRYKIRIGSEDILCRLESIDNYEPKNASQKCTFIYFIEK